MLLTASRHVLRAEHNLDCDDRNLEACTHSNSCDELVSKPLTESTANIESVEHAAANGKDCGSGPDEWGVDSKKTDEKPACHCCQGDAYKVWNRPYT